MALIKLKSTSLRSLIPIEYGPEKARKILQTCFDTDSEQARRAIESSLEPADTDHLCRKYGLKSISFSAFFRFADRCAWQVRRPTNRKTGRENVRQSARPGTTRDVISHIRPLREIQGQTGRHPSAMGKGKQKLDGWPIPRTPSPKKMPRMEQESPQLIEAVAQPYTSSLESDAAEFTDMDTSPLNSVQKRKASPSPVKWASQKKACFAQPQEEIHGLIFRNLVKSDFKIVVKHLERFGGVNMMVCGRYGTLCPDHYQGKIIATVSYIFVF